MNEMENVVEGRKLSQAIKVPPGAATGEVWIRTDPRIDAELKEWA